VHSLDNWGAGVGVAQGVEEVLWRHALHVGWSVSAEGLGCGTVALATALDLVCNDAGGDDEEDAAQSAAEGDQDDDAIGVVGS
jgi:hypothetical protein